MAALDSAPSLPPASGALNLPGPAGLLESLVDLPEQDARRGTAVICHPHPLHGLSLIHI